MIDAKNLLPCLVRSGTKTSMIDRTQVQLSVGILFAPSDGGQPGSAGAYLRTDRHRLRDAFSVSQRQIFSGQGV